MDILIAILALGGLGLLFGLILSVASKVFYVEEDPRLQELRECLPGADCGGCGYTGCGGYAEAVLNGKAEIGKCAAGGDECAQAMAAIMGMAAGATERKVALVRCNGYKGIDENGKHTGARQKGEYEGIKDCLAATKVAGRGPLICKYGCLGFGTCTTVCKYDAIHIVDGIAKVDREKCVGCMACAKVCPRNLIVPVDYNHYTIIACASKAKGATTIRGCSAGCIGCGQCVKACPYDAIRVEDNLAIIDSSKCTSCGLCAIICPQQMIASPVKTTPELSQLVKAALKK